MKGHCIVPVTWNISNSKAIEAENGLAVTGNEGKGKWRVMAQQS